ncbi:hypothetical protein JCM11251_000446 [Rhodosporidiobolus azoricus]
MDEKTVDGYTINLFQTTPSIAASQAVSSSASTSRPTSIYPRSQAKKRIWRSSRVDPEELKSRTPWYATAEGKSTLRKTRWTCLGVSMLGLLAAAAMMVTAWMSVPKHKYCLVFEDHFDGNALSDAWFHEIEVGGFGNGEFEMTTSSTNNSFVEDGKLYIVPTLTSDHLGEEAIMNGHVMNLTRDGTCTRTTGPPKEIQKACEIFSNSTYGNFSIIPPIQSARLLTKFSHSLKYGRVKAKMPTGDWIWPAIWMLPTNNVYGDWPKSGEIDIVESMGNLPKHNGQNAANVAKSRSAECEQELTLSLHSLDFATDGYAKTMGEYRMKKHYTNERYNIYGLDWDDKGLSVWTNLRSRVSLYVPFSKPFWKRGSYAYSIVNGSSAVNPWTNADESNAAPFDQEFYLILSTAVGGTNGWFNDGMLDKPWSNASPTAARDFWIARKQWLDSWPTDPKERAMAVEYVKMWRLAEPGEVCEA